MKRLSIATLAILAFGMANAQSLSVVYDFKAKATTPATVIAEKRVVDDLFGVKWLDLDLLGLVGATFADSRPTLGSIVGAIAIQPRLGDDRIFGQFGIAGRMEAGRPVAAGLLFGLKWKFAS